jgi:hypothetical protein
MDMLYKRYKLHDMTLNGAKRTREINDEKQIYS